MAVYRAQVVVDGIEIEIEAPSLAELKKAIADAGGKTVPRGRGADTKSTQRKATPRSTLARAKTAEASRSPIDIVNLIKDHDRWSDIERKVLDRKGVLPRVLMVGYFAEMTEDSEISSRDVEAVTAELGVRISMSNAATCFKKQANRYFTSDRVRRPGQKVKYRVNRAGKAEFERNLDKDE